jgi:hypothetical protein
MGRQITWYPPAHTGVDPLVFTDYGAGFQVFKGTRGLGKEQRELVTTDSPFLDGTEVDEDYALPRSIMLPMGIHAADRDALLAKLRLLEQSMRTRAPGIGPAPGELELAEADGRRFRLRCHYRGGLPDEETVSTGGDMNWVHFQLQLLAPDPYWYSAVPRSLSWVFSDPIAFLGSPFLPLRISAAQVIGDAQIINNGTENTYGTWRITRPGTELTLSNVDSGEELHIVGTIPVGEVLTIVTEPRVADIALQPAGTDWWNKLQDGSTLWAIPPGTTQVSLTLIGSASGSRIDLEFYERFGSPW